MRYLLPLTLVILAAGCASAPQRDFEIGTEREVTIGGRMVYQQNGAFQSAMFYAGREGDTIWIDKRVVYNGYNGSDSQSTRYAVPVTADGYARVEGLHLQIIKADGESFRFRVIE